MHSGALIYVTGLGGYSVVSKQKQADIRYWLMQAKDKNLGWTIREFYKDKLRAAGVAERDIPK